MNSTDENTPLKAVKTDTEWQNEEPPDGGRDSPTSSSSDGNRELIVKEEAGPNRINIQRDVIDLEFLSTKYGLLPPDDVSFAKQQLVAAKKQWTKCSCLSLILSLFPILSWLPGYSLKKDLANDVISGFTVAILHIPQGIAYSLLAGLEAVHGLYVSFFPVLIYVVMGTSRHISLGTFAVCSLMLNNAAVKIGAIDFRNDTETAITSVNGTNLWPPTHLEVLTSICLLTGFIQFGLGVLRLGVLSVILSDHLVSSFSTGVAFHVATSQLNNILGLQIPNQPAGPLKLIYTWVEVVHHYKQIHLITICSSVVIILVLVVFKELIEERLKKLCSAPFPIDLLVVIVSTLISWLITASQIYHIKVVGEIPQGLPMPSLPRIDLFTHVLMDSIMIGVVCYAVSLSLGKMYAKKHHYVVRPNQELLAMGTANVFGSLFEAFPAAAALSRSAVQEKTGRTQVAGLVSCAIIVNVLLFLGYLLHDLPKCTLSCIILVALKSMFMKIADFGKLWAISRLDALCWLVTLLSVIFLDVDLGLIVGISVSILFILIRLVNPTSSVLGQVPSTEIYVDTDRYRQVEPPPNTVIFQFSGSIFYLNLEKFKKQLVKSVTPQMRSEGDKQIDLLVIIDCSSVSFVDSSGVEAIVESMAYFREQKVQVRLAGCPLQMIDMFDVTKFFDKWPRQCLYPTVHDAVTAKR